MLRGEYLPLIVEVGELLTLAEYSIPLDVWMRGAAGRMTAGGGAEIWTEPTAAASKVGDGTGAGLVVGEAKVGTGRAGAGSLTALLAFFIFSDFFAAFDSL